MATRCTSPQQFIETFHRFCDEQSFFVATMNMRPVGLETPFSIQLQDKSPVLRGLCVVLDAWATPANPYKRPGIRLGIRRLTPESEAVFYQLQAMRTATPQEVVNEASEALTETPVPIPLPPIPKTPPPIPRAPTPRAGTVSIPPKEPTPSKPIPVIVEPPAEQRTPGSELILPANPLSNIPDEALTGFIDCTLYEETGNFFRAPDDGSLDEPRATVPAMPPIDEPALQSIDASFLGAQPAPRGRPTTLPPTFGELPIVARTATGELVPLARTTTGEVVPLRMREPPVTEVPSESSMKASLQRVETSVMRLLDVVDTSRPIDQDAPRPTPMPAGEAYAVRPPRRPLAVRTKHLAAAAGAVLAIVVVIVVVIATRGEDAPKRDTRREAVAMTVPPAPRAPKGPKAIEVPVADAPAAAIADEPPPVAEPGGSPVVGEGPCRVDVKSNPAGTMVQLDGQTIGPSPITIAGPCTKRQVTLVHPRYKQEVRSVTPETGKPAEVDVTLVRPTHSLLVTSQPSGATVSIAGRRAGTTPTRIPLMGFTVLEVKVEKKGYDAVVKKIYSKRPDDRLAVPLPKAGTSGRLNL